MHTFRLTALILGILASAEPAYAYEPTRHSLLDPWITGSPSPAPRRILVQDANGKLLESANLAYSADGRLREERYADAGGQSKGSIMYEYSNGRITREATVSKDGKLLTERRFDYREDRLLSSSVYGEAGQLLMKQTYTYSGKDWTGGSETVAENTDRFAISLVEGLIREIKFTDSTGKWLASVSYEYDAQRRLVQRQRRQGDQISLCKYGYGKSSLPDKATYLSLDGQSWIVERVLVLDY